MLALNSAMGKLETEEPMLNVLTAQLDIRESDGLLIIEVNQGVRWSRLILTASFQSCPRSGIREGFHPNHRFAKWNCRSTLCGLVCRQ